MYICTLFEMIKHQAVYNSRVSWLLSASNNYWPEGIQNNFTWMCNRWTAFKREVSALAGWGNTTTNLQGKASIRSTINQNQQAILQWNWQELWTPATTTYSSTESSVALLVAVVGDLVVQIVSIVYSIMSCMSFVQKSFFYCFQLLG